MSLSTRPSIWPCLSVLLPFCVLVCPCVSPSVRLYVFASVRRSICLSAYLFVRPSVCPSVCLSVRSSVLTSVFPSVLLLICLSVSPSVCLSVCSTVRLSDCPAVFRPSVRLMVSLTVYLSVCRSVPPSVLSTRLSLLSSVCLSFCCWSFLRSTVLLIFRLCISLPQHHIYCWQQS